MLFFTNRPTGALTKIFVRENEEAPFDFNWLATAIVPEFLPRATRFHCNETKRAFTAEEISAVAVAQRELKFAMVFEQGQKNFISAAHTNWPSQHPRLLQFFLRRDHHAEADGFDLEKRMILKFAERFEVLYAYSRAIRADYDATTETKVRQEGTGAVLGPWDPVAEWLFPGFDLDAGVIKGIYPVNYWGANVDARLQAAGIRVPPRTGDSPLRSFGKKEQGEISRNNPQIAGHIRFKNV